jgi:hypothetical protein
MATFGHFANDLTAEELYSMVADVAARSSVTTITESDLVVLLIFTN